MAKLVDYQGFISLDTEEWAADPDDLYFQQKVILVSPHPVTTHPEYVGHVATHFSADTWQLVEPIGTLQYFDPTRWTPETVQKAVPLPLAIRDTPPECAGMVRLTGTRDDGLPDGVHTGGAWLCEDGLVYKPLDGRPYANCENHFATRELDALQAMEGQPLFPKNWNVAWSNGRKFLVRKKAYIVGRDTDYRELGVKDLLQVEQAVRAFNQAGWELNDPISLARDPDTYELFILDLSSAHPTRPLKWCDDTDKVMALFKLAGQDRLVNRREQARWLRHQLYQFHQDENPDHVHVYASFYRPFDFMWADRPEGQSKPPLLVANTNPRWDTGVPHTWILTTEPLSPQYLDRYELAWGWSPVHPAHSDGAGPDD